MYTRIKQLRKELKLSQEVFGKNMNLSKQSIANMENNFRSVTERTFYDICNTYNVSESWLRTGEGEMFRQRSRDEEIAEFIGAVLADESDIFKKSLILALSKLDTNGWEVLRDFVKNLATAQEEQKKEDEI